MLNEILTRLTNVEKSIKEINGSIAEIADFFKMVNEVDTMVLESDLLQNMSKERIKTYEDRIKKWDNQNDE